MEAAVNTLANSATTDKTTIATNVAATASFIKKLSASEQAEINAKISQLQVKLLLTAASLLTNIQALKTQVTNLPEQSLTNSAAVIGQAKVRFQSFKRAQQSQAKILAALQHQMRANRVAAVLTNCKRA